MKPATRPRSAPPQPSWCSKPAMTLPIETRRRSPVGAARDADEHAGDRAGDRRDDASEARPERVVGGRGKASVEHRVSSPRFPSNPTASSYPTLHVASHLCGLPAVGPRPVADRGGLHGRAGAREHARSRAPDRSARLSPLLGRRAPRRPDARGPEPEALIGPIAAATDAHPRRQRRRDAAALQPVQGGRDLQHPGRAVPGRIDLGDRACRGHRPDDDVRAAARPPPGIARRLPRAAGGAARLPRRWAAGGPPVRRLAKTLPGRPQQPEPWLLGSSPQSAIWAAELGLPYAFADFINPSGAEIAAHYRERFAAHEHGDRKPRTAVAVWVICAESDEEAQHLAASGRMAITLLRRGQLIPVPPPEKALEFLAVRARASGPSRRSRGRTVSGSPETVRAQLEQVVAGTAPRRRSS